MKKSFLSILPKCMAFVPALLSRATRVKTAPSSKTIARAAKYPVIGAPLGSELRRGSRRGRRSDPRGLDSADSSDTAPKVIHRVMKSSCDEYWPGYPARVNLAPHIHVMGPRYSRPRNTARLERGHSASNMRRGGLRAAAQHALLGGGWSSGGC